MLREDVASHLNESALEQQNRGQVNGFDSPFSDEDDNALRYPTQRRVGQANRLLNANDVSVGQANGRLCYPTEGGVRHANGLSYPTEGGVGQANRLNNANDVSVGQANGLSYPTEGGVGQANGLSYPTEGDVGQANGLSYPTEGDVGQANGLSYPTERGIGQANGLGYATEGGVEQANRLNNANDASVGQANGLSYPTEGGVGQTNGISYLTEEDVGQANGLSYPTEKGVGQANGLYYPSEGVVGEVNGQRFSTEGGVIQGNGLNHPTERGVGQANGLSDPTERGVGLANGLTYPNEGRVGQANGLNFPTQGVVGQANGFSYYMSQRAVPYHQGYGGQASTNLSVQETGQPAISCVMPPGHWSISDNQINAVSSTNQNERAIQYECSEQELTWWKQKLNRSEAQKATRNKGNANGSFFIMEITEINQHRLSATPIFSSAIYTDSFEWKLGVRIYLNGVENGSGRDVAVFVHMMKGEWDDLQDWPFSERITISFLDQSGARCRNHISQIIQANPTLQAFQKPIETICRIGCGFVKFAPIATLFSSQYVKNDKLFLKIEFSS